MQGPADYIRENRAAIMAALAARELRPEIHLSSAERMAEIADDSVELVVTSPPYPLIEMWDAQLGGLTGLDPASVATAEGFRASHEMLSRVWAECARVLVPGGILALNIGDATRKVDGAFQCIMNHAQITRDCESLGFQSLVPILWKKPTNKPNAFLGSGFFPPNAYVTLDCEFILILRKGGARTLPPKDPLRYASQYSKAERDVWFSQIWEIRGAQQEREGTAPFPAEVPYRLVRMFSCLGDTVLDPFAGTGTTLSIARALGRRAVGYEINPDLGLQKRVASGPPNPDALLRAIEAHYATPVSMKPGDAPASFLAALANESAVAPNLSAFAD